MTFKHWLGVAAVVASLGLGTVGLGTSAHAAQILKINESLGPGSAEEEALKFFKKTVEDGSRGELQIAIHLQDELGNPQSSMENLMTGSLELYSGALEYYAPLATQEMGVTSLPYFFSSNEALHRYLNSPIFAAALKKFMDHGIRVLEDSAVRGPYRVLVSTKPILKVEDLQGLKLRMYPNDVAVAAWAWLGTVPLQVGYNQTYLALRQGVVQGVTTPLSAVRSMKFTEVAPYIVAIKEYPQVWPITVSERVWERLTPDQQKLLQDAANGAAKVYTDSTARRGQEDVDAMLKDDHAVFIELDTEQFHKKMEPFYQKLIKDGTVSQQIYDAAKAMNK